MAIRPTIEAALSATADRLSPGFGESAVRQAKNDLGTIGASSENFDSRYAGQQVAIAAPVVFEAKHPDGDPVTFAKKHEGIVVVFADSLLFVRGMGFGAREVKSLRKGELSVEKVTTVLDGCHVPGLRVSARNGKPKFAVAIGRAGQPQDATQAAAVRDEIVALLQG